MDITILSNNGNFKFKILTKKILKIEASDIIKSVYYEIILKNFTEIPEGIKYFINNIDSTNLNLEKAIFENNQTATEWQPLMNKFNVEIVSNFHHGCSLKLFLVS